jgi:hypothetical protein
VPKIATSHTHTHAQEPFCIASLNVRCAASACVSSRRAQMSVCCSARRAPRVRERSVTTCSHHAYLKSTTSTPCSSRRHPLLLHRLREDDHLRIGTRQLLHVSLRMLLGGHEQQRLAVRLCLLVALLCLPVVCNIRHDRLEDRAHLGHRRACTTRSAKWKGHKIAEVSLEEGSQRNRGARDAPDPPRTLHRPASSPSTSGHPRSHASALAWRPGLSGRRHRPRGLPRPSSAL